MIPAMYSLLAQAVIAPADNHPREGDGIFQRSKRTARKIRRELNARLDQTISRINAGWLLKSDVGVTTRKGSGPAPAITIALNDLIKSGKYRELLSRWALSDEVLEAAETNPPGLPKF